jgi:hypothetical protein
MPSLAWPVSVCLMLGEVGPAVKEEAGNGQRSKSFNTSQQGAPAYPTSQLALLMVSLLGLGFPFLNPIHHGG